MKIYLAGPMRGYPLFNFPAFHEAARFLIELGHEVWNPAEFDESEGFNPATDMPKTLAYYMKHELPHVCDADAVVVLPGWRGSQGANLEVHVAREVGVKVIEFAELLGSDDGHGERTKQESNRKAAC